MINTTKSDNDSTKLRHFQRLKKFFEVSAFFFNGFFVRLDMFRLDRKLDLIFKIHNVGMMKNGVDLKIDASTRLLGNNIKVVAQWHLDRGRGATVSFVQNWISFFAFPFVAFDFSTTRKISSGIQAAKMYVPEQMC